MATPLAPGFGFSGQARKRLSFDQVKHLAEAFGLPGTAIAQIARGESGLYADVQQRDPGDGMVGYGLLQMTPNAWGKSSAAYKHLQSLGGVEAMKDPAKNMAMARFLYQAAGNKLSPWYGTRFLTDRSGEGTLKPIDPHAMAAFVQGTGAHVSPSATRTVTTSPGVDNSDARKQALSAFLLGGTDPTTGQQTSGDILSLALQMRQLKDVPAQTRTASAPAASASAAHASFSTPKAQSGTASFEGKKVAAWIAPALDYARRHGWKGTVESGFRSFADQTRIYNSGVRPAAKPGTSNHEGTQFPRGAVDVTDAATLSRILQRSPYGGRLKWAGAKDPVHFSHPHNGSY